MDINDIRECARYFKQNYLDKFYIVTTYNGNSFILVGEKINFPHLMGISKRIYNSNGYRRPNKLYEDILGGSLINTAIIPNNIATNSKMYKKAINFCKSSDIIWHNTGPLAINYNDSLSTTQLKNVSMLLVDINSGYMMGWVDNQDIPISTEIKLKKYCIVTWIDESLGTQTSKEKYMPIQNVDLIKSVLAFNEKSELVKQKEYRYSESEKIVILRCIERNNSNLLVNSRNEGYYTRVARRDGIHCKINGIVY